MESDGRTPADDRRDAGPTSDVVAPASRRWLSGLRAGPWAQKMPLRDGRSGSGPAEGRLEGWRGSADRLWM